MRTLAVAGLLIASSLWFLPALPPLWGCVCLLFLVLLSCWKRYFRLGLLMLYFVYVCSFAGQNLSSQLPKSFENKVIDVYGQIVSLPVVGEHHVSFEFKLSSINSTPFRHKVRLNWYGHYPKLKPGQFWRLQIKLKRAHGFANPGGFDYAGYLLQKGIVATGYVKGKATLVAIKGQWLNRLRQHMANTISALAGQTPYTAMIKALVMGDKHGIAPAQWQILQKTGTNHLMVIAGLHVGMVTGLIFALFAWLWRRSERLMLMLATPRVAAIAAVMSALMYSALAGFSVPTIRATIMIAVFMLAIILRRPLSLGQGLLSALLIVLILQPLSVLTAGFWLSFGAVSVIFYGMSARLGRKNLWWKWGRLQWLVALGLMPLTLLWFHNASFISPIANSFAIPLVGLLVVPLSLLGSAIALINAKLASVLFWLATKILAFTWMGLHWFASLPLASVHFAPPSRISVLIAMLGLLLLLAPRAMPAKWLGMVFCLPIFLSSSKAPVMGGVRLTVLDVGQGLATVIQTAHHSMVYDTGAKWGDDFDMGQAVVVPYLQHQGIRHLDLMMISHGDNDHIGGAASILKVMPVERIATSVPYRFPKRHANYCLAGQHWQWDGVYFRVLYPTQSTLGQDNNSSCVLRISTGRQAILLTGDIEKAAEQFLVNHQANYLPATLIVAPHHGSNTSSTLGFLHKVHPSDVIYSTGYLNRFHFPSKAVVQRYQKFDSRAWNTAVDGAVSVTMQAGKVLKILPYREQAKRFWFLDISCSHFSLASL